MYDELESRFKVILPQSSNATYSSIMNFSGDLEKPLQRWYRYKEGYSLELVESLISEYSTKETGVILDPFLGSGTTLIKANQLGYKGVGFEVNPFSYFLSKCKLKDYPAETVSDFRQSIERITQDALPIYENIELPKLSISDRIFEKSVQDYLLSVRNWIESGLLSRDQETMNLLLLGWLSSLEELSYYRKAGNGLKKRITKKPSIPSTENAKTVLLNNLQKILSDIHSSTTTFDVNIINDSSINMDKYINDGSITGIIFSPPYANCFDYTEIYKIELWFGRFVKNYSDLRLLRDITLRSHLSSKLNINDSFLSTPTLDKVLEEVEVQELWSKKIPVMLRSYFTDMFTIISKSYLALESGGFCCIVVGNSAYGGVVVPTDLLLADYAERVGFVVDKIEVDRYIITSSQQYEKTKSAGKYLRESVVCLVKK